MNKKGFTLIESVIVLLIMGILANLAIPNYIKAKKHAEAVIVISDFYTIREACATYYAVTGLWPKDTYWAIIPKELKPYLPADFKFDYTLRPDIKYSLDNYIGNTEYQNKYGKFDIAVSVHSKDAALINSIIALSQGNIVKSKGFFGYLRLVYIIKESE